MELTSALLILVLTVAVVPLGLMLLADRRGMFDEIGGGAFSISEAAPVERAPSAPASAAERAAEIRQLVQARNDRRVRRGEPALDVDAEAERLLALDPERDPGADATEDHGLLEEVHQLVDARNQRRVARGEAPLDVEAEVRRTLERARD